MLFKIDNKINVLFHILKMFKLGFRSNEVEVFYRPSNKIF